ncbi:MAG: relaxase domain-containing protein, partial [Proteobacteria bacterium]|nr:relaxase domain-containing protein [Pseudomonadota bacterium]
MADHLLEQTLTPEQAALAQYYQQGLEAASPGVTVAEPRRDLDPRLAALLGLDPNRAPTRDEIAHLLNGSRTDGAAIPGKQIQKGTESLAEILGLDAARVPSPAQIAAILAGKRADGEALAEKAAGTARGRFLELYGVPREREASAEELDEIRAGQRADGTEQRLGPLSQGLAASRARIGYVDLCWSADKSVSLAWAFAPTEAERNIIAQAHRDAVSSALLYVEAEIGQARRGKAGQDGAEPGQIGWVRFDHYASRPTVEVPRVDRASGEAYTELVTLKVAGDPQLHTHVAIPNVVLTEGGRVGGLDLQRLEGRIKEFGAYYQAHLATNLRCHGVEVALDPATGAARVTAIPEPVRAAFSKRTQQGTEAARAYARSLGLDWDSLDAERKIGLAKQGVQGDPRQVKQDDLSDWASWRRQADSLDWQPASVLQPDHVQALASREVRLEQAYTVGRDLLDRELQRRAVLDGADARVAAARGLIASGVESADEIGAVTRAFAQRGVRHDGQDVGLVWGMATDARGQEMVKLTTTLHADRETELVQLAQAAASDRSAALLPEAITTAVAHS